jgi:hypothetical protein
MTQKEDSNNDGSRELPVIPVIEDDIRLTRGQDMTTIKNKDSKTTGE